MSSPVNKLVLIDVIFEIERNSNLQLLTWSFLEKKRTLQTIHELDFLLVRNAIVVHINIYIFCILKYDLFRNPSKE